MDPLQELAANPDGLSEEAVCALLAEGLQKLYSTDPEAFFALMYRLDIPEAPVHRALESEAAMAIVAHLVYQRQLEKARHRKEHREKGSGGGIDPDLKW